MRKICIGLAVFVLSLSSLSAQTTYTDDFNRSNGALGANWTTITGLSGPVIVTNQVEPAATGADYGAYYSAPVIFPANQYSQIKVITLNTATSRNAYVTVRTAAAANTYYEFRVRGPFGASTAWQVNKIVAGSSGSVNSGTTALASGDTIYIEATGGSSTVVLTKVNGVQISSDLDNSSALTTGFPGFKVVSNAGVAADVQVDDWQGGCLSSCTTGNHNGLLLRGVGQILREFLRFSPAARALGVLGW